MCETLPASITAAKPSSVASMGACVSGPCDRHRSTCSRSSLSKLLLRCSAIVRGDRSVRMPPAETIVPTFVNVKSQRHANLQKECTASRVLVDRAHSIPNRKFDQGNQVFEPQLFHQSGAIRLDRPWRQMHQLRDLCIRVALGDQPYD